MGHGGKPGEAKELPLCEHSPRNGTRVKPCRSQDLSGGLCVSPAGTAQPGISHPLPGNQPLTHAWEFLDLRSCGTLRSQSAGHFPTARGKSLMRVVESPAKCTLPVEFPFPQQILRGEQRRG